MRYIIFKCIRNKYLAISILSLILSGVFFIISIYCQQVFLLAGIFLALSFFLSCKNDPSGYEGKVFVNKLSKWKYIYKGNFLNKIYKDFLSKFYYIDLNRILINLSQIEYSSYSDFSRWSKFLANDVELLNNPINIEICTLLYKITDSIDKNFNPICSFYPEEKKEEIKKVIQKDIAVVRKKINDVLKNMDESIEVNVHSVINENEIHNQERDIVNETINILSQTTEFVELLETLKKYTITDTIVTPKLKLILENVIVYYEKYQNSNDDRYKSEFRKMMKEVKNYLDDYNKNEFENIILNDIAGVKAVSNFCKLV